MFGHWKFEVSSDVSFDRKNSLAIKIYPLDYPGFPAEPQLKTFGSFGENGGPTGDIGKKVTMQCSIGWDWVPEAKDRNMGIWQPVVLTATAAADISYPTVITKLINKNMPKAFETESFQTELTIKASLQNLEKVPTKGLLKARLRPYNFSASNISSVRNESRYYDSSNNKQSWPPEQSLIAKEKPSLFANETLIEEIILEKEVELAPFAIRETTLDKEEFPQLLINNPRLWWPSDMGFPHLYELELNFIAHGAITDREKTRFGIREIKTQIKKVNGWPRRDFFHGGAWVPEILLRREANPDWLLKELLLWCQANLNFVRLWGGGATPVDEFFNICDKLVLLVWHDFWITGDCQATWGKGSRDWPLEAEVFLDNARKTVLRLPSHPSLFLWTAGNEDYPRIFLKIS